MTCGRMTCETMNYFRSKSRRLLPPLAFALLVVILPSDVSAAEVEKPTNQNTNAAAPKPLMAALPPEKWQQVEKSVDRGLAWIASQQAADGSFPTLPQGQPAVTSFCVMAFLSRGHQPGVGPYGQRINRAIDYVLSCQMTNGLISLQPPGSVHQDKEPSHTASYNHAISGLMLGEVYGQVSGPRAKAAKQAIERALKFSRQLQTRAKAPTDKGGWRYTAVYYRSGVDSDLSVTGWYLMFLRSAKNAEFDVPQAYMDEAIAYVRRLWDPVSGVFNYEIQGGVGVRSTRGMVGAGILCLSMAGQHQTPMARAAGDWLVAHPFTAAGESGGVSNSDLVRERFFYSAYYCSQAMVQLGGRYWEQFFPPLAEALLRRQTANGSWPPEEGGFGPTGGDSVFGTVYSTSLAVLSLTPPYQLLPVYQR
jgi:hypothetical protein